MALPKTRADRDAERKAKARAIVNGKKTLAEYTAADIKALIVILVLSYLDDDVRPNDETIPS